MDYLEKKMGNVKILKLKIIMQIQLFIYNNNISIFKKRMCDRIYFSLIGKCDTEKKSIKL